MIEVAFLNEIIRKIDLLLVKYQSKYGTCDGGMSGSTTTIVCADLAGYGNDYFNDKFYMQIIKNANNVGKMPEGQTKRISDYVSDSGTFTVDAFAANVEAEDDIYIMHESDVTFIGLTESNTKIIENTGEIYTFITSPVKAREFSIPYNGIVKMKCDVNSPSGGGNAKAQVYINGGVVGSEQANTGIEYNTLTFATITVEAGDYLQMYYWSNSGNQAYIKNVVVYGSFRSVTHITDTGV